MAVTLNVNGQARTVDADPDTPLLWVLRDELNLEGTKFGCGQAVCGACTVILDGAPVRSCQATLADVGEGKVVTVEGLEGREAEAVRDAWRALDVVQCGYCQSGQIMSAVVLLTDNKKPTDEDIDAALDGNICRCATYQRVRAAIHDAARRLEA